MIFNLPYVSSFAYVPQHCIFDYGDLQTIGLQPTDLHAPGTIEVYSGWPQVGIHAASTLDSVSNSVYAATSTTHASTGRIAGWRTRRRSTVQTQQLTDSKTETTTTTTTTTQSVERQRRLYCSLCRVKLNADQQAEQHYRGKLHARKSRRLTMLTSNDDTCSGAASVAHSQTGHTQGLQHTEDNGQMTGQQRNNYVEKSRVVECRAHVYCSICGTSFNSDRQSYQHYRGKLHAKKLRLARYLTRVGFTASEKT